MMDSIIREESSLGESSLFNHRAVFKKQSSQPKHEVPKLTEHNINTPTKFTMSSKKKAAQERKSAKGRETSINADLGKVLSFSKNLDSLRPGSSQKANAMKQSKFSLNFSLKPALSLSSKKNASVAGNEKPYIRRFPTNLSSYATDSMSTRVNLLLQ